jgi:hypothetical protein
MIKNRKTTIAGGLLVAAGVCGLVASFFGMGDSESAMASIMAGLAGLGLVGAQDGGA